MIILEVLKERLSYDPTTGIFRWRGSRNKGGRRQAGTINPKGYRLIETSGIVFMAHRLAWFYMTGQWPQAQIDHINKNKDDNRFVNLREATNAQNKQNAGLRADNSSGYKGVIWDADRKKWRVQVKWPGEESQRRHGRFNNLSDAVVCANIHIALAHGPFASLNVIPAGWCHD